MNLAPHPFSVDNCPYTDDVNLENVLVLHQLVTTPTGYCFQPVQVRLENVKVDANLWQADGLVVDDLGC